MRRAKPAKRPQEKPDISCETCIHGGECDRKKENSFCTQWRSNRAEVRQPDPNDIWKQGGPVEF